MSTQMYEQINDYPIGLLERLNEVMPTKHSVWSDTITVSSVLRPILTRTYPPTYDHRDTIFLSPALNETGNATVSHSTVSPGTSFVP